MTIFFVTLLLQDGQSRFEIRRLQIHIDSTGKPVFKSVRDVLQLVDGPVTGEHQLFVRFEQVVEHMEQFFLCRRLALKKMDVVNQ
jgi:hypothetical protein